MPKHLSNSEIQQKVEAHLRARLEAGELIGAPLSLGDKEKMKFDGCNSEQRVIVEIISRIGATSSSRDDKVMSDAMKMLYFEKQSGQTWRKFIVTNDDEFASNFIVTPGRNRTRWQAEALCAFGIEVRTLKLSDELIQELLGAQADQALGINSKKASGM